MKRKETSNRRQWRVSIFDKAVKFLGEGQNRLSYPVWLEIQRLPYGWQRSGHSLSFANEFPAASYHGPLERNNYILFYLSK